MTTRASGTFDVTLAPLTDDGRPGDPLLGRMSIDKRFSGDLEGTSVGQMLSARTAVAGSAAYVAIEKVTGVLGGRRGTFVLAHRGTMTRGEGALEVAVVPDSGTDELTGLAGTLAITIRDGKHFYDLDYTLGV